MPLRLTPAELAAKASDDPVLAVELARRTVLVPEPTSTQGLIARIRCPTHAPKTAHSLTVEYGDHGIFSGFLAVIRRTLPELLANAYRQSRNPLARNRGAVFMHAVTRKSGKE